MIVNRVACVMMPGFLLGLYTRSVPEYDGKPLALAESEAETALIVAVNDRAAIEGITPQMTVAQARALCRNLLIIPRQIEREMLESNSIYKVLQKISPYVEEQASGVFYLDISGFGLLYRTEEDLARTILTAVAPSRYPAQLGLGANRFVAFTAACRADAEASLIIPSGKEKQFLSPLSVNYLPLSEESRSILEDLGIRRIGQLASISTHDLTSRLGPEGIVLARLVRGEEDSVFVSGVSEDQFSDRINFTFALKTVGLISTHTEQLLAGLFSRLGQFSQGCCCVNVRLSLEDRSEMELRLAVDRPTLSARKFLRQLALLLGKQKLTAGVTGLQVTIPAAVDLAPEQKDLAGSEQNSPQAAIGDLDWSLFPAGLTVSLPRIAAGLIPEQRVELKPFSSKEHKRDPGNTVPIPLYAVHSISGLRLLRPAEAVEVSIVQQRPGTITRRGKRAAVTHTDGPWRLTGGWWNQEYHRLYYEIETDDSGRYLLYFDRAVSRWLLQGIFD